MKRTPVWCATIVLWCAPVLNASFLYRYFDASLAYPAGGTFVNEAPLQFGVDLPGNNLLSDTRKIWHVDTTQELYPGDPEHLKVTFELTRLDATRIPRDNEIGFRFWDLDYANWDGLEPIRIVDGQISIWFDTRFGGLTPPAPLAEYDPGSSTGYWTQDDIDDQVALTMDRSVEPNLQPVVPMDITTIAEDDEIEAVYIEFKTTPEPTTLTLLGISMLALLRRPRRR
jgi:hypothetical protein